MVHAATHAENNNGSGLEVTSLSKNKEKNY